MLEPIALTQIPCSVSASAATFVSWFIPPFDAQYTGKLAMGTIAIIDSVLTKAPAILCPFIDCAARCVAINVPLNSIIVLCRPRRLSKVIN